MPKNSRPDIQVLEDRVLRLKSQISEYKDLRLYKVTKERLSRVCDELEECIGIINDVVDRDNNNINKSSFSAFGDFPGDTISEFSSESDTDLVDTLLLIPCEDQSVPTKSAKEIVRTYSSKMEICGDAVSDSTGIIQVNQFRQMMASWYKSRFDPEGGRNKGFFFKAHRIHEWIDLLIIASGNALNEGLFSEFIRDMNVWIENLNTSKDQNWVLPYNVMRMQNLNRDLCTFEAVLIEKTVKPFLYDESFYQKYMHSVEDNFVENFGIDRNDLSITNIIEQCPKLILTSSFNLERYAG